MKLFFLKVFLLCFISYLAAQELEEESIADNDIFTLTVFEFEGGDEVPPDYLLRYGQLELDTTYTVAELRSWVATHKKRLEADRRIFFVEPDLVFFPEDGTVELYLLVSPNTLIATPGGGNSYFSLRWTDFLIEESLFTVFAGYNRQSVLWNVPYIGKSDFGFELSGGHHIQNHFDFSSNIYSDFFLRKYFFWHPLPELRIGPYQQLDAVAYYNGYQGSRDLLGRWQVGLQLDFDSRAPEGGFGYYLESDFGWRPLGQFSEAFKNSNIFTIYGKFAWFRPYLTLEYAQSTLGAETQTSLVKGSSEKDLLLRSAATLDLIFLPIPTLFKLVDIGFLTGSSIGVGGISWQDLDFKKDVEHSVYIGPYFDFHAPVGVNIGARLGLISNDFWQNSSFAWSLTIGDI